MTIQFSIMLQRKTDKNAALSLEICNDPFPSLLNWWQQSVIASINTDVLLINRFFLSIFYQVK